ncbi:MAG: hypothetical protein RBR67_03315 [Desulfobacterium sp.]|jgi:hypothetical protein|nr:hypothetical protein [Desulfobacterium sp.]
MADMTIKENKASFDVSILIKKEDGMYVAHCLELDIVAVADSIDEAQREMVSLVCAQVDYAFSNGNLENLFHPAPAEVWEKFYRCGKRTEREYPLESGFPQTDTKKQKALIPPWLIAKTCEVNNDLCYA